MGLFDRLQELRDTLEEMGKALQQKPASPPPPPQTWQEMYTTTAAEQPLDWDVRLPEKSGLAEQKAEPDRHHALRARLHSRSALRQAIVIKEILDKPLALRRRR